MKKLILIGLICLIYPDGAFCQIVCPPGSQPVTFGATRNTVADAIQPNFCVDKLGNLSSVVFDNGAQWANIMGFGAKGDGQTNDEAAFHVALSAACSGTKPGVVLLPPGRSFLGLGGLIPPNCRVTGGGTILFVAAVNQSLQLSSGDEIDHLIFNGTGDVGVAIIGSNNASGMIIDHDTFENFPNGSICIAGACGGYAGEDSNILITENQFYDNQDGALPPVFNVQCGDGVSEFLVDQNIFVGDGDFDIGLDGCQNSQVIGNLIAQGENGFGGAIQPEATSESMSGLIIEDNQIISPHFADGYAACGIELHTNGNGGSGSGANILTNFQVIGNYVSGGPGGGICLEYNANDTNTPGIIANNFTYSNAGAGMNLSGGNLTITGNVSMNNAGAGFNVACIQAPCNFVGNTATDDQTVKTQTYGLIINGSPWLPINGNGTNYLDGNLTGPVEKGAAFNSPTVY